MSAREHTSIPLDKVDSVDRGAPVHVGTVGGFTHDGQDYILMAESPAAMTALLKTVFPEFAPKVEKFREAVLISRKNVYLEGDEL